jgi:adenine phosphoribosyltransferase
MRSFAFAPISAETFSRSTDPTLARAGQYVAVTLSEQLAAAFRWIDPGPDSDHLVSDLSGWWRDPALLASVGDALADLYRAERPTVVVAPESGGLVVGPLVAVALGAGFAAAVKEGADRRLADPVTWADTPPDYRGRRLRLGVRSRHLGPGDRVLVVDDWVATGAQVRALYDVATARRAEVVGCAAIVAACSPSQAGSLRLRSLLTADDLPA